MVSPSTLVTTIFCLALGAIIAWLVLRTKSAVLRERVSSLDQDSARIRKQLDVERSSNESLMTQVSELTAKLQQERTTYKEKLELLDQAEEKFSDAFQALAAQALSSNNQSFLDLAKAKLDTYQEMAQGELEARQKAVQALVDPIKTSLTKVDEQIRTIEEARNQAYGSLSQQVASLITTQDQLRGETSNLVKALRTPSVRGRWGEIQLRRVVEIAGNGAILRL